MMKLSFKMHRKILVLLGFNRIRMQDFVIKRGRQWCTYTRHIMFWLRKYC